MSDEILSDAPDLAPPRALVVAGTEAVLMSDEGEIDTLSLAAARRQAGLTPVLVCHAPLTLQRLGLEALATLDLLELFAFVHPARFCVPTPKGLADALDLPAPTSAEGAAFLLWQARTRLLDELAEIDDREMTTQLAAIATQMGQGGWRWAGVVLAALGNPPIKGEAMSALGIWSLLPKWEEAEPEDERPTNITQQQSRQRLAELVARAIRSEPRPEQSDYASALTTAFAPPAEAPHVILAEAGTGVGKTLGYLAPASLWGEEAGRAVWLSTYTRNLQRQIETECARLYPDSEIRARKVVIRKGRENYLCLLNYEEAVRASFTNASALVTLGLVARWLMATKDGDIKGGDFPGWLPDLIGRARINWLSDRKGECLHAGCPHYRQCFIESSVRRARGAELVIANHALIMNAAASGGVDEQAPPSRFIFDEGHHIFHAADSAFGADLSGQATHDLRRWLLGGEGRSKGRVRGLAKRAEPLLPDGEEGLRLLDLIKDLAQILPGDGWHGRLERQEPRGPTERFLIEVQRMILARDEEAASPYSIECTTEAPPPELLTAADALREAIVPMLREIAAFRRLMNERIEQETGLEGDTSRRIASLVRTLESYVLDQLRSWNAMLENLHSQTPPDFVDWFGLERSDGRMLDVGLSRRYLDPTKPFAEALSRQAAGLVVTSATLTDPGLDTEESWQVAGSETGAAHFAAPFTRAKVPSPFNYAQQTRVLVVTDVPQKDDTRVAEAYRELFLAAHGGALGLFTAIERLKKVHRALLGPLAEAHLPLYAQHVDGLDPATLIDIFRAEVDACLLGTDAVRDGVDVPGDALRLIVFDRIPWPRSDILYKARKDAMGGVLYAERLTRQKLRQAFGRLIRRADDRGIFVLLSPLPSRLASAFPDVVPERVTLAEAIAITKNFLPIAKN